MLELFFERLPGNGAATLAHAAARMLPLHFAAQGCSDLDTVDFVWSAYPRLSLSLSPSLSRFLSRAFSVCARARVCVCVCVCVCVF